MAQQTYTIEMKVSTSDEGHEAMQQIVKQYARDLLASAMLLQQGRNVLVSCRVEDAFYDTSEIELLDPSDELHTPE